MLITKYLSPLAFNMYHYHILLHRTARDIYDSVVSLGTAGQKVERASCIRGTIHSKIHLIRKVCTRPSIALHVQNHSLKHHSIHFIMLSQVAPTEQQEEEAITVTSDVDEVKKDPDEANELDQIRRLLAYIVDDMRGKEKEAKVQDEWKALATVLDRTFFWLTLITALIILPIFLTSTDSSVE